VPNLARIAAWELVFDVVLGLVVDQPSVDLLIGAVGLEQHIHAAFALLQRHIGLCVEEEVACLHAFSPHIHCLSHSFRSHRGGGFLILHFRGTSTLATRAAYSTASKTSTGNRSEELVGVAVHQQRIGDAGKSDIGKSGNEPKVGIDHVLQVVDCGRLGCEDHLLGIRDIQGKGRSPSDAFLKADHEDLAWFGRLYIESKASHFRVDCHLERVHQLLLRLDGDDVLARDGELLGTVLHEDKLR